MRRQLWVGVQRTCGLPRPQCTAPRATQSGVLGVQVVDCANVVTVPDFPVSGGSVQPINVLAGADGAEASNRDRSSEPFACIWVERTKRSMSVMSMCGERS